MFKFDNKNFRQLFYLIVIVLVQKCNMLKIEKDSLWNCPVLRFPNNT